MKTTENTENTEGRFVYLSSKIIGLAIETHKHLGPGLLESAYQRCFVHELKRNGISCLVQKDTPIFYKGEKLNCGYRADVIIENKIIVELKAVESISPLHQAQILTYMRLTNIPVGLIINFNVLLLKNGIKRLVI